MITYCECVHFWVYFERKKEAHVLHNIGLSINLCSGALVFECNVLGGNIKIRSPSVLGRCTYQTRLTWQ